jgi:hypothetical protein
MRKPIKALAIAAAAVIISTATVMASGPGSSRWSARLVGYEEVPAISTSARGSFSATIAKDGMSFDYELTYGGLTGGVTQSHIHFGQKSVNGGISVFFCSNLGNGPVGTQACPAGSATVTGHVTAANVIGPAGQGIAAGEWNELIGAIRAGVTYVNVHSATYPGGEIRGQLHRSFGRGH